METQAFFLSISSTRFLCGIADLSREGQCLREIEHDSVASFSSLLLLLHCDHSLGPFYVNVSIHECFLMWYAFLAR